MTTYTATTITGGGRIANHSIPIASTGTRRPTTYTATTIPGGGRTVNDPIPVAPTRTRRATTYTATTIPVSDRKHSIPVAPSGTRRGTTYTATTITGSKTKYNSQSPSPNAHRRREYVYNNQDSSRRWESFKDQRPKSRSEKTGTTNSKNKHGNNSQSSSRPRADANSSKEVGTHYTVLGLTRSTTADGIKKAYRKMAIKYHPDKNIGDPNAADNFRRVKEAYETLSDLQLKRKYDLDLDRGLF